MPAGITFTSTLIAMHFIESLSIPIGVLWIIIMWAASIASGMSLYMNIWRITLFSGQYSFGQGMVGIVLGVVFHFYATRSPIFARIIDFFISLIAGFVIIFLAMVCEFILQRYSLLTVLVQKDYPEMDFSFASNFLVGLAWQVTRLRIAIYFFYLHVI